MYVVLLVSNGLYSFIIHTLAGEKKSRGGYRGKS